ncbi:isoaspartyl peptidase/L-asparaginase family protein [Candidatus Nitrospira bockiana]
MRSRAPVIAVHGGAGRRTLSARQRACLEGALRAGFAVLDAGGTSLAAVEAAIRELEGSGLFNAGVGARLQLDGARRLDASIMEGRGLRAGAVAAIEGIRHPITAARLVMEETDHVLLVGAPAARFARQCRLERLPAPTREQIAREAHRRRKAVNRKSLAVYRRLAPRSSGLETVGAVALDAAGILAAGASTGGVSVMLPGRVGDTPLIGCGVYADNAGGAVSMTGIGETIIRLAVAKEIVDRLSTGAAVGAATRVVLDKLVTRVRGEAGALVLDARGRLAIQHTSPRMAAGHWAGKGPPTVHDCFR